jgi:Flp pilus assembly protein TadD/predicted O-methyltransferase YrrM
MNRKQRRADASMAKRRGSAPAEGMLREAQERRRAGDLPGAVERYDKALAIAPDDADALMGKGGALAAIGHPEEAIQCFRRAAKILPKVAAVHRDFGAAMFDLGRWDEGIAAFQRALAIAPADPVALTGLGEMLVEVGRRDEARSALERAILCAPLGAPAYFQLHRAVYDDRDLGPAIDALTRAVLYDPELVLARFCLGVALDQTGSHAAAEQHFASLHADKGVYRGAVESFRYAKEHGTAATRFFATTRDVLLFAIEEASLTGAVLELGVRYGTSTRWIAERAGGTVHAFDSFEGLPEAWHVLPAGAYSTHGVVPALPANVEVHVGLFDRTLPAFAAGMAGPVRFMNVDCDLYSSTKCVLDALADRVVPGTVIVFDEYLVNDAWKEDELKAWKEAVAARGWRYEYLAFSMLTGQAVVRVL